MTFTDTCRGGPASTRTLRHLLEWELMTLIIGNVPRRRRKKGKRKLKREGLKQAEEKIEGVKCPPRVLVRVSVGQPGGAFSPALAIRS